MSRSDARRPRSASAAARNPAARNPAARPGAEPTRPVRRSATGPHGPTVVSESENRLWTRCAIAILAVLCLVLLTIALGSHRIGDVMTETDFYGDYAQGARLLQQGKLLPARYGVVGPGYEIALALTGFLARDLFLAARLLSIAASISTVWLWFLLLRRRLDARVGILAALFMATNATFLRQGYSATTDAYAIALQAAAMYLLLARGGARAPLWAGMIAGIAFLTRYNAVYLLPLGLVALWLGGALAPRGPRSAGIFALGFLTPVVPWVLFSLAHGGAFSFQLHHNIAFDVFARAKGIAWDDYQRDLQPQFKTLWDVIARDPGAVTSRMFFNVWDHLRRDARLLLGWPVAVSVLLGVLLGIRDGSLRRVWPVLLAAALLFGTLVPIFYGERYSLALLPAYAMLAALFFASPRFAFPVGPQGRIWLKTLLAAYPLFIAAKHSSQVQAYVADQLPVEVLECAETLRELKRPGDQVICRKAHIAYYAGVESAAFPFTETIPDLADYAHRHKIRWLYFSWPEAETRPRYYYLLDTTAVVPGLTPRRVTRPHPAVLYEIGPTFGQLPTWWANDTLRAWHVARGRLMIEPHNTKLLYQFGGLAMTRGHFDGAIPALQHLIELDPRNVAGMVMLGTAQFYQQDYPNAGRTLERAVRLDPSNVDARIGLGWVSLLSGRPEDAADRWRPLIPIATDQQTLLKMAELYRRLGDVASADAALARQREVASR